MTTQQISEQVRNLILQGELDDAANTLVQFFDKEWMSRGDKAQVQLYNQALYQLSQLNELKHQVFAGIISNEEADLKRNKIRAVLLEVSNALATFNPTRAHSPAPAPPSEEQGLRHKRRIAIILILGIPLSIMVVMLVFGVKTCNYLKDNVLPTEEITQQQPITREQPVTPTAEETFRGSRSDEPEMTGCFVRTRMMTGLLMQTEVMGQSFMELPDHTEYQVLEVKKVNWARQPVYFFKIKHDRYEGWVRQVELEFVSPECLR